MQRKYNSYGDRMSLLKLSKRDKRDLRILAEFFAELFVQWMEKEGVADEIRRKMKFHSKLSIPTTAFSINGVEQTLLINGIEITNGLFVVHAPDNKEYCFSLKDMIDVKWREWDKKCT